MVFSSLAFIAAFLPISVAGFWWFARNDQGRAALLWLTGASMMFYASWDWRFLPLLVGSIAVNWWIGGRLLRSAGRLLLTAGVILNLLPLALYKYGHWGSGGLLPEWVLPLGLSFYTFQQIAYLVDCARGEAADRDPLRYALFVSFFPQLVAGPIVHHVEMTRQFRRIEVGVDLDPARLGLALWLIAAGLAKKLLIADWLAGYVDPIFADAAHVTFVEAWTGALGYTLQLYFDFSAYCEMAMGFALLVGIRIPVNFDAPYASTNITEFWRRWHITLGRWFRHYVYIPLGGNRHGVLRMYSALLITMLMAGLWHGAGWTFVLWGALHAAMLIGHRLWSSLAFAMPAFIARTLTLSGIVFAWVAFRAESVGDTLAIWRAMLGLDGLTLPAGYARFIPGELADFTLLINLTGFEWLVMAVALWHLRRMPNPQDVRLRPTPRWALAATGLCAIALWKINTPAPFLYWNF